MAGDKYQLEPFIPGTQPAGGLHTVQPAHLHIQKNKIQLSRVVFVPLQQGLPGGKLPEAPLLPQGFQRPFQLAPQHQARVCQIVADPDPQQSSPSPCFLLIVP